MRNILLAIACVLVSQGYILSVLACDEDICLAGFCEEDNIYMLAPPKSGRVLRVNKELKQISVQYYTSSGQSEVRQMSEGDIKYNLRRARGCSVEVNGEKFCVNDRVYVNASSAYGVVVAVSPNVDSIIVQRENDRTTEDFFYGAARGNVTKIDRRRPRSR